MEEILKNQLSELRIFSRGNKDLTTGVEITKQAVESGVNAKRIGKSSMFAHVGNLLEKEGGFK